jgi:hypothetical protein
MEMANTPPSFSELWSLNTEEGRQKVNRIILAGIDRTQNERSMFAGKIRNGPTIDQEFVTWLDERDYPRSVQASLATNTLTFSGNLFGSAITAVTILQIIRVGTILERVSDGVQVEVTDIAGLATTPWDCTVVVHGGTTLSDDSEATEWTIEGELWTDLTDATNPRALDRITRKV